MEKNFIFEILKNLNGRFTQVTLKKENDFISQLELKKNNFWQSLTQRGTARDKNYEVEN